MHASSVCPACNQTWGLDESCQHCGHSARERAQSLPEGIQSRLRREWQQASRNLPRVALSLEAFEARFSAILRTRCLGEKAFAASGKLSDVEQFVEVLKWEDLFLTTACAAGDQVAWETFHSRYQPAIRAAALRVSPSAAEAADLSDTLLTDLFLPGSTSVSNRESKIAQYHGMGSLEGWVKVVVHRLAIDRFRSQRKVTSLEALEIEPASSASSSRPDRRVEEQDTQKALKMVSSALAQALRQLDATERLALSLYYVQDLNLKEIARWLKAHESTASRMLDRLRERLRKSVSRQLQEQFKVKKDEIKHLIELAQSRLEIDLKEVLKE